MYWGGGEGGIESLVAEREASRRPALVRLLFSMGVVYLTETSDFMPLADHAKSSESSSTQRQERAKNKLRANARRGKHWPSQLKSGSAKKPNRSIVYGVILSSVWIICEQVNWLWF
jgi:hypothetical protein